MKKRKIGKPCVVCGRPVTAKEVLTMVPVMCSDACSVKQVRMEMGLDTANKAKQRECLKCSQMFDSKGPHNRTCYGCKQTMDTEIPQGTWQELDQALDRIREERGLDRMHLRIHF